MAASTTQAQTGLPASASIFVRDALERAAKSAANAALSVIALDHVVHLISADWVAVGDAAALGAIVSLLMSIGSQPVGNPNTASLVVGA